MDGDTPQGTAQETPSVEQRIQSLLAPAPQDKPQQSEESQPEAEPQGDAEGPVMEAGSEAEGSDESQPEDQTPDETKPPKFKVKIGETEVDQDELVKGYLRQSDYTKKTQELAEKRKADDAERNALAQERARYAQNLEYLAQQIPVPQPPSAALLDSDPIEYLKQREAYESSLAKARAIDGERQRLYQQQQAEAAKAFSEARDREEAALLEKIPEWKEPEKAREGKRAVAEYLKSYGYTDQDIGRLVDHRSVDIARKAFLYDQMQKAKSTAVEQKVRAAPPVIKPGSPVPQKVNEARISEAKQALRKTGSINDAAKAILALQKR